ncbi:MAG: beta-eliminating lyase-related protein [Henriciella sp.]|nr:beta-eliminating lyase-related protein [Henriciella sp.]
MDFSSDTSAPTHPAVLEALAAANAGNAPSYGDDAVTAAARAALAEVFETDDFDLWMCASGTASNALALSCFCPPTGAVLCHEGAHIAVDERGAPEFFSGGGKLQLLPGSQGKIDETALRGALARINHDFVHETPAHVLSLTNLTESGCAYRSEEIAHFAALAHEHDLTVHLDGARLANALVSTGASPAEMSWRAGVDVLTFGLTKTGAIGCEIILLFGRARAKLAELKARAKRSGHMPPKMRFLAAQATALLQDGLWLELARAANRSARQVANVLCAVDGVSLAQPVDGNEVFVTLPDALADRLLAAGAKFYPWPDGSYRLVCSWVTSEAEIEALRAAVASNP